MTARKRTEDSYGDYREPQGMIAYKLVRVRKNGTLGPLFINVTQQIRMGETHAAEDHKTEGYAHRPGWHCLAKPRASHLMMRENRHWVKCLISDYITVDRPEAQGGIWYLANMITFSQQFFMRKFFIDEASILSEIENNKKKPTKKSSFQKRLEQMAKKQQDLAKKRKG